MIYLLSTIGLSPGGSITVHIYTQTIHKITQITANLEECGPCPVFESYTLAFALQLRKPQSGYEKPQSGYSIHITKTRRCVRLTTLPLSCAVVMKSGNLNFLEPSGPHGACNGTALPLLFECEGPQWHSG